MNYNEFKLYLNKKENIDESDYDYLLSKCGKNNLDLLFEKYLDDDSINEEERFSKSTIYLDKIDEYEDLLKNSELNAADSSLNIYFAELGKYKLLDVEEERIVLNKISTLRSKLNDINFNYKDFYDFIVKYGYEKKVRANITDEYMNEIEYLTEIFENRNMNSQERDECINILNNMKIYFEYKKYYDEFINSNLRLGVSIAKRYGGRGLDFSDLFQHANIGLMKALDKFDIKKGYKFSTYATWWVRQNVSRSVQDEGSIIRKPVHVYEKILKYNQVVEKLTSLYGNRVNDKMVLDYFRDIAIKKLERMGKTNPTEEEIIAHSIINKNNIETIKNALEPITSLDKATDEKEKNDIGDFISDPNVNIEQSVVSSDLSNHIDDTIIELFNERDRIIIAIRNGINLNKVVTEEEFSSAIRKYQEKNNLNFTDENIHKLYVYYSEFPSNNTLNVIGDLFGLTRERIRQIEEKSCVKLRRRLKKEELNN